MSEKLKLCPFCCSAGIVKPYRTGIRIKCPKCGVISGQYETRAEAIEAWNKRPALEASISAYEALCDTVRNTVRNINAELEILKGLLNNLSHEQENDDMDKNVENAAQDRKEEETQC